MCNKCFTTFFKINLVSLVISSTLVILAKYFSKNATIALCAILIFFAIVMGLLVLMDAIETLRYRKKLIELHKKVTPNNVLKMQGILVKYGLAPAVSKNALNEIFSIIVDTDAIDML